MGAELDLPGADIGRYAFLYAQESIRRMGELVSSIPLEPSRWFGGRARQLLVAPTDLRIADPVEGEDIVTGRFAFAGELLLTGGRPLFSCEMPSEAFAKTLAGFGWLRHLRTQSHRLCY